RRQRPCGTPASRRRTSSSSSGRTPSVSSRRAAGSIWRTRPRWISASSSRGTRSCADSSPGSIRNRMRQTLVLDVVGLTAKLLPHAPRLAALARQGATRPLRTITPAVTCSVQATFLTGLPPSGHGVVANGWYFRDLAEVWLWRQSNHLVGGEKVWEAARRRDPSFTCAKLFWWYNMYASVDVAVTPRPMYLADGRKLPDIHTHPAALRDELQGGLGDFPLFRFW